MQLLDRAAGDEKEGFAGSWLTEWYEKYPWWRPRSCLAPWKHRACWPRTGALTQTSSSPSLVDCHTWHTHLPVKCMHACFLSRPLAPSERASHPLRCFRKTSSIKKKFSATQVQEHEIMYVHGACTQGTVLAIPVPLCLTLWLMAHGGEGLPRGGRVFLPVQSGHLSAGSDQLGYAAILQDEGRMGPVVQCHPPHLQHGVALRGCAVCQGVSHGCCFVVSPAPIKGPA